MPPLVEGSMYGRAATSAALVALLLAACSGRTRPEDYRHEVERNRAAHEADYRKEYVSLAGLAFLEPGPNTAGSAEGNAVHLPASTPPHIGTFVLDGQTVRFEPAPGAGVTLKGQPVTAPVALRNDGGKEPPDELTIGPVAFWVHNSGDRRAIRIRDEQGEVARTFAGFTWFPIDRRYRVVGRFIKDPEPHDVKVPMITGDFATYKTEGLVEFTLEGQTIRMRPMTTRPNRLFFIFTDGTTGKESYHAARFLYCDLKPDGTTVLDFNEAYNPPCSFNPYTTCPLPPPENRMTVRVLAGEKDYVGRHIEPAQ
jgi:uncharacterized protein (DUF1684 family)